MTLARQIGLIAAGSQPWNSDICAASEDRFAYCATMAVYIYQFDTKSHEYKLHSIMAEHKKKITAISWSPYDRDLIVTAGSSDLIIVWNVSRQKSVAQLTVTVGLLKSLGWGLPDKNSVIFVGHRGPLQMWNFTIERAAPIVHKDIRNFSSDVCQFRCHPSNAERIAFGHADGTVSFHCPGQRFAKHAVIVGSEKSESAKEDSVTGLEWDPQSINYLLAVARRSGIALIDTSPATIMMRFQLPSAASTIHSLSWIPSAPGLFITGDAKSGVLRLWNVSKTTPIESFRLNRTGLHSIYIIPKHPSTNDKTSSSWNGSKEEDGSLVSRTNSRLSLMSEAGYEIPSVNVLSAFKDGGIGLYDLGRRRWNFIRDKGHIETIFDCKFSPDDPDLLATGSFDGTIKVWDVRTLKMVYSSSGNEGIIYSLSWSPSDPQCIAASTSKNGAFIWDMLKGKVIKRFLEHKPDASIYTIAWNQKDMRRLATAGSDEFCIIHHLNGTVMMKYPHPDAVYGCDWSPHNADIIATGCGDKNVRVFYLVTNTEIPVKVYSGHKARVFQVRWSSLREGILVSGSDDCTIRLWDYTQDSCIRIFQGHTAPVRGLVWNPEIPYLLISGSWDCSIRVWDTRDGACLGCCLDHGADVYGLACHAKRPFVLASSSRDSTVRLWTLGPIVQPIELNVLADRPWDEIFISPVTGKEHAMSLGTPPLLAGKCSREIKLDLERQLGDSFKKSLELFSGFFGKPEGCANLWQLVNVCLGSEMDVLSCPSYQKAIVHSRHVVHFKQAEAQQLEMVRLSKFGTGLGLPSQEECLRDAANINIKLGNIQHYCELMIELGEWDKALAVAPSVSMSFWKNLILRRAEELVSEDRDEVIPYGVASGDSGLLVDFLTNRGQRQDAYLVAAAANRSKLYLLPDIMEATEEQSTDSTGTSLLNVTTCNLADWHFHNGSPILAACYHLSIDDHKGAMSKLIRGYELELAAAVGHVLQTTDEALRLVTELLARRCERIGCWDLGVHLLRRLPGTELALAKLCARCAASMSEIDDLHKLAGFPSLDNCMVRAKELLSSGVQDHLIECIKFFMLSNSPEIGLKMGIDEVKDQMSKPGWQISDVYDILQMVASMQTERLQKHPRELSELLVLCSYAGILLANQRNYESIIVPLFMHTLFLMKRDDPDIPQLSQSLLSREMTAWEMVHVNGRSPKSLSTEQQSVYDELLRKSASASAAETGQGSCWWPVEIGPDVVLGSNLPNHSDVNVSCLNDQRIQGPVYFLEDGRSALSLSDALMWAKVSPFSPLGSGIRINPF